MAAVVQQAGPGKATGRLRSLVVGNVAARLGALAALAVATVMVARAGGPALVGAFTLLRVLPGLAGVLAAAGLPGAAPYLPGQPLRRPAAATDAGRLDRARRDRRRRRLAGAYRRCCTWRSSSRGAIGLVLAAAIAVFTQLFVAVGKSMLQGEQDLRGANVAIVAEEAAFLPVYLVLLPFGHGATTLVVALVVADVAVALAIAERLRRRRLLPRLGAGRA